MLPKISDEQIKNIILETRITENLDLLQSELPIWMVEKTSKKRKMNEDERSELMLAILEKLKDMWKLSLKYDGEVVLGFFVTYGFNLFRNAARKTKKLDNNVEYIELWQEKKYHEDSLLFLEHYDHENIQIQLDSMPPMVGLVLALRYDLPMLGNHRKSMEWRLKELDKKYVNFERIYDKKKEKHLQKIDTYSARVVRYTRLLLDCLDHEKRRWYLKKKKEWAVLRDKALNKCFFSEREISLILGLTRKEIRSLISKGIRLLYMRRRDLLRSA